MSKLRKDSWPNGYIWSGPVTDALAPGRRTVERLELRKVGDVGPDDLRVLHRFPDLTEVVISGGGRVDLDGLAGLPLSRLGLGGLQSVDLEPVTTLPALRHLGTGENGIRNLRPLRFPRDLELLYLRYEERPEELPRLLSAIDWERLSELRTLMIFGNSDAPVECDLSFLRHLPKLDRLDLFHGVWHASERPSPLEPPFDGLSRGLTWIRIDAWDPKTVRPALAEYLDRPSDDDWRPTVYQRHQPEKRQPPWTPQRYDDGWTTYGSLHDEWQDAFETEYDASDHAEQRVREADPKLADRTLFDPESAGTGISAASQVDLKRALSILKLGGDDPKAGTM